MQAGERGAVQVRAGRRRNEAAAGENGPARQLLDGIQLLVRRFAIAERADVTCCGLTVAQSATLDVLRAEGPLRPSELGRQLGVTASTLTRNLDRLVEARLVTRKPDPRDARAAQVALTAAGAAAARQVAGREEAFAQSILERLPEGRRQRALEGLADLLLAVREATEACCPGAFDHLTASVPAAGCRPAAGQGGRNECAE